eukprot:GHVS01086236.1.p1 GENE.GHVS01086236.1~~GHVS01086236.1.p1  ORF type:complete len:420 (+),score=43.54 GHVS01086236.1:40-1260(+)
MAVESSSSSSEDEQRRRWEDISTGGGSSDLSIEWLQRTFQWSIERLAEPLHLSLDKLLKFHAAVRLGYRSNPYHNFYHATQVFQGCHVALTKYNCKKWLRPVDELALLSGALCHDIDHPGVNNGFLKNLHHPLALLYDDLSVLEQHHAAYSFRLLSKNSSIDFRQEMSSAERTEYHKKFLLVILSTDMDTSAALAAQLKERCTRSPLMKQGSEEKLTTATTAAASAGCWRWRRRSQEDVQNSAATAAVSPLSLDATNESDRDLLLSGLIHCMDIGNVLMAPPINLMWADMVTEEFQLQVELEKKMALPVTVAIDAKTEYDRINMQISFLNYIALPRWRSLSNLTGTFGEFVQQGEINYEEWKSKADQLTANGTLRSVRCDLNVGNSFPITKNTGFCSVGFLHISSR